MMHHGMRRRTWAAFVMLVLGATIVDWLNVHQVLM